MFNLAELPPHRRRCKTSADGMKGQTHSTCTPYQLANQNFTWSRCLKGRQGSSTDQSNVDLILYASHGYWPLPNPGSAIIPVMYASISAHSHRLTGTCPSFNKQALGSCIQPSLLLSKKCKSCLQPQQKDPRLQENST